MTHHTTTSANTTHVFLEKTEFEGLFVINPKILSDERGYFFESYNEKTLLQYGLHYNFVQDNQARSQYGVLRGLHFQAPPFEQAKLVRVVQGAVLDIAVDIRPNSNTFGKAFSLVLSDQNHKQMLIPRGFAHGYVVLTPTAEFVYKCDNYYSKAHDMGIIYNDPQLNINWQLPQNQLIISEKDKNLPTFTQLFSK